MSQENSDFIAHIWTVREGKIVRFDELSDTCVVAAACQA